MKKYISIAIVIAVAASNAIAQQTDTIVGRCDRYYYSEWYDQCYLYEKDCDEERPFSLTTIGMFRYRDSTYNNGILMNEHHTANHMAVKGIAAMVPVEVDDIIFPHEFLPDTLTHKLPEQLMLFQADSLMPIPILTNRWPHMLTLLDSVRWDTAAPHVMRLPMCSSVDTADTSAWVTLLVYEAYFPEPLMVDTVFYVGGTMRNNFRRPGEPFMQVPTAYTFVSEFNYTGDPCQSCDSRMGLFYGTYPFEDMRWDTWHNFNYSTFNFGPFLPIVDFYQITAYTSETNRGTVDGGGRFPAMAEVTIEATPHEGYVFYEWSDGSTENPRTFTATSDLTLRAFFVASE